MPESVEALPKLIVILGPTAAGKTAWSLACAKEFGGEIISADSRQIYKKMDIGSGKAKGEWVSYHLKKHFEVEGIRHYLIDFLDPGKNFTVAEFHDKAVKYAAFIHKRQLVPFVVGGTGMYISSFIDNWHIPRIAPNKKLRLSLEEKSVPALMDLLKTLDPVAATQIDRQNKRRVIRALEVCILSGEPFSEQQQKGQPMYDVLQIGVEVPRDELYERIDKRVDAMMEEGLLEEVEALVKQRYGWGLQSMSGIGFRQFKPFFEGKKTLDAVIDECKRDTRHFARRQLTWFRRDERIVWCKTLKEARDRIAQFLGK